ncbi:MAG: anthranilate phosphoribosyltransferase, partial [Gammaproteobacteria bacterium]|nr:anthranilate phosphoribosyltransferase [Gammaproteobacteria bacterium]
MQVAIQQVMAGGDLSAHEMGEVMRVIMRGEATHAQTAGLLVALRMKGETVDEIAAAAQIMRELVTPVSVDSQHLVDIVGTGGDGMNSFNI